MLTYFKTENFTLVEKIGRKKETVVYGSGKSEENLADEALSALCCQVKSFPLAATLDLFQLFLLDQMADQMDVAR